MTPHHDLILSLAEHLTRASEHLTRLAEKRRSVAMPDLTTSEGREELRRRILARNTHSRALAENWSIEAANLLTLLDLADAGEREWRAIDSAPKDGTRVLVASHDFIVTAEFWVYEGTGLWRDDNGESLPQPTHWMPLPPPPARVAADQPLTGDR